MTDLTPPHWRRPIFLGVAALAVGGIIWVSQAVMFPFVMAFVLAYLLTPAVAWCERKRVPRAVAIIGVYLVGLATAAIFIRVAAPRLVSEVQRLRSEFPALLSQAKENWIPGIESRLAEVGVRDVNLSSKANEKIVELRQWLTQNPAEVYKLGKDIVAGVSRGIFLFIITLMLAAYVMLTRERIVAFLRLLVRPAARVSYDQLLVRIDRGLSGVVRGQLIICLINGVLSAIGFAIVGLKYWPVLALVASVLSLIPIFGSIASTIPAVAIGLTQGLGTAVFVLCWIVGIHQLEANVLNPKIMGDAAKLHPVLVVFSLLAGEHLFGAIGALLAVPCMSIAKSLFVHFLQAANAGDPELQSDRLTDSPT